MSDELFELESQVTAITTQASAEVVLEMITRCDWLGSRAREIKKLAEEKIIEWINANGEIELGTIRWYVGNKKIDKCVDIRMTVIALFDAVGGEFDLFCEALSSNAIKVGAARKILGDAKFAELFSTVIEQDLKTGKPVKVVHKVDSRFVVKTIPGNVPEGDQS